MTFTSAVASCPQQFLGGAHPGKHSTKRANLDPGEVRIKVGKSRPRPAKTTTRRTEGADEKGGATQ